ncbi:MAG TPA: PAS domain-containing sensor histidine kinase [Candidatus Manganitrophaceae bacterium]|nr:PAS domain-containing sensor histidine kinase [Candidatus Manganitrophaceae bacterium]
MKPERSAAPQAEIAQQRYRDLVEGLDSTAVWEMGAESFQVTFVSRRAEALLGYPLEEWYTDPTFWRDRLHPEDRERVLGLFNNALEEGTDQRCDHRMVAADGRIVWFHTGVRPVREKGGTAMFRGLSVDMTAQREAAEEVRKSQERYQGLIDSIEGIVWEADAETFRFRFVSKEAERPLGYPVQLWLDDPDFWKDHVYPDDLERVMAGWKKGTAAGTGFDLIYRMVTADGPTLWVRNIARVSMEKGRPRFLRGLIDSIEGIVWEADAQTFRFRFVSKEAERPLGYPVQLWLDDPDFWKDHVYPDDLERIMARWKKGTAAGTGFDLIYRMVTADGPTLWVRNIARVSMEKGRPRFLRGLIVDISERVRVEEALKHKTEEAEEASRVKSDFLSIASHEIRTPLNAILGYASLLKEGRASGRRKQKEISERIYLNAKEMLDLINRILELNKIEAGRMDLHAQAHELSLSEMVQQVLRDLRLIWEEKGLKVTWTDDPTAPPIRSDSGKLRQIFTNLIANAVKFTDRGSIAVRLIHDAKKKVVSVEIKDTGAGIPESDLSQIFEPFYQGEKQQAAGSGTGLGLSIVKKFVEYLKGSITATSHPGAGSVFVVTLPYDIG